MPNCPKCGAEMVRRKAKYGPYAGNEFYGCPNWKTSCKGVIINIDEAENDKNSPIDADKFSTQSKSSPNIKAEKKIAKTKDYSGRSLNIPAKILDIRSTEPMVMLSKNTASRLNLRHDEILSLKHKGKC